MISMDEIKERVILVAVDTDGSDQAERSLDELGELAKTAGAEVVGRMIQPRERHWKHFRPHWIREQSRRRNFII